MSAEIQRPSLLARLEKALRDRTGLPFLAIFVSTLRELTVVVSNRGPLEDPSE